MSERIPPVGRVVAAVVVVVSLVGGTGVAVAQSDSVSIQSDGVVVAQSTTTTADSTTNSSVPGFGPVAGVTALAVLAVGAARVSRW